MHQDIAADHVLDISTVDLLEINHRVRLRRRPLRTIQQGADLAPPSISPRFFKVDQTRDRPHRGMNAKVLCFRLGLRL